MKKWAALALIVAAGAAALILKSSRPEPSRLVPFPASRRELIVAVKASGTVQPKNLVQVRSPIYGRMETLVKSVGERVDRGSVLAEMSSADRAAILDESLSQGATTYEKWKEFYRPTAVVSPVAGMIINRGVVKGDAVRPGEELFTIADELVVVARADETDVTAIRGDQEALLRFDAYPDQVFPAKVLSIGLQAERSEGVSIYKVVIRPLSKPEGLKTGMNAEASFVVERKTDALTVSAAAVGGRHGVKVRALVAKSPRERPRLQVVVLGVSDGRFVEIKSGLAAGEALLVPEDALGLAHPSGK